MCTGKMKDKIEKKYLKGLLRYIEGGLVTRYIDLSCSVLALLFGLFIVINFDHEFIPSLVNPKYLALGSVFVGIGLMDTKNSIAMIYHSKYIDFKSLKSRVLELDKKGET